MANQLDALQPQDVDAEEALLGSILRNGDAMLNVANVVGKDDFFVIKNGWIFAAMKDLHEKRLPIDNITLSNELTKRNQLLEIGGPAHLTILAGLVPTSDFAHGYAKMVADTAILRRLIDTAGKVARMAYEAKDDAGRVVDKANELMMGVRGRQQNSGLKHYGDSLFAQCDRVDDIATNGIPVGVKSGLTDYDKFTGGFQRSDMIVIAARPGVGKTSLAITVGLNAARQGRVVGVFTMEMSKEQLAQRILSMESELDVTKIRRGEVTVEEQMLLNKTANDLNQLPIFIDDTAAITLDYLRSEAMRLHAEVGLDLLIVDYLQLMSGDGFNRQEEVSKISKGLKTLAKELNIPIIVLAQLNRQVESRADKRPMLSDLRESGAVEQDGDLVVFIYRDEVYNEDTEFPNIAELIIAKHRNGATGKVSVFFKKQTTKFCDLVIEANKLDY